MSLTARQAVLAALAANVLHPLYGRRTAVESFAAGWPVGELAPQLLALSLADTALAVRRRRATPLGLGLACATTAGLAWSIRRARRSRGVLADELSRRLARPFHFRDPAVRVDRNIGYGPHPRRNTLDVYRPAGREVVDAPVLVQIHGGAWTIGAKEEQGRPLMNRMAARGWVCIAINYRLAPKYRWPAQIDDVETALAWVEREIKAYGGDPDQVVLTGGSAGGHLAALAALRAEPGRVVGCVPFYGVYDMLGEDQDVFTVGMRESLLEPRIFAPGSDDATYRAASPLHQDLSSAPDFFLLHGTHDSLVSVRQARAFAERLRRNSPSSVTYAELPGAQHAFDIFGSIRAHHAVDAVERWLTALSAGARGSARRSRS